MKMKKNLKQFFIAASVILAVFAFAFIACNDDPPPTKDKPPVVVGKVATPIATPGAGQVPSGTTVTLTTTTADAEIRFTTNGSTPTANSTLYANPIPITGLTTIKAIAIKDKMDNSDIMEATYSILAANTVAEPTASHPAGNLPPGTTIVLSTITEGATIRYTTNGDDPTTSSTVYAGPIPILGTMTIKALAHKDGMTTSSILTRTYTIVDPDKVVTPVANPAAGAVDVGTRIVLSTTTAAAEIRYTTDGTTPTTTTGTVYAAPGIEITAAMTIRAIAYKSGMTTSDVLVAAYTITNPLIHHWPMIGNGDDAAGSSDLDIPHVFWEVEDKTQQTFVNDTDWGRQVFNAGHQGQGVIPTNAVFVPPAKWATSLSTTIAMWAKNDGYPVLEWALGGNFMGFGSIIGPDVWGQMDAVFTDVSLVYITQTYGHINFEGGLNPADVRKFGLHTNSGDAHAKAYFTPDLPIDAYSGKWTHYALNIENQTATLYINGVAKGTVSQGVSLATLNSTQATRFFLGNSHWHYILYSKIADVRIYDRAQTADQINAIINLAPAAVRNQMVQ